MSGLNPLAARRHRATVPAAVEAQRFCRHVARLAVRSLYQELVLYPKPGLVSLVDNGSHTDMDAACFMRSLFSLRHYFRLIAAAGMRGAAFAELKQLAMAAEQRMLRATGGINTHRGAIFCLGLLCAASAACHMSRRTLSPAAIRSMLLDCWGEDLRAHAAVLDGNSHGLQVAASYAVGGAREEGAQGFPALFEIALPQLQATLAAGRDWHSARIDTLFALMAHISDTNVYHRGGAAGAQLVRDRSRAFLVRGATGVADWQIHALQTHQLLVQQRLSPGGAADLLAAACLLQALCGLSTSVAGIN